MMILKKKIVSLSRYCDGLLDYLGHQREYSAKQVKALWRLSGLSVSEVADKMCRSYERARDYCYGQKWK